MEAGCLSPALLPGRKVEIAGRAGGIELHDSHIFNVADNVIDAASPRLGQSPGPEALIGADGEDLCVIRREFDLSDLARHPAIGL